jgi:hypothetical protein
MDAKKNHSLCDVQRTAAKIRKNDTIADVKN